MGNERVSTIDANRTRALCAPLSRHQREEATERELTALSALTPVKLVASILSADGSEFTEETLVATIRFFLAANDQAHACKVFEVLFRRLTTFIRKNAGTISEQRDNLASEIAADIYSEVHAGVCDLRPESEFWECRFWSCLAKRTARAIGKHRRRGANEMAATMEADDGSPLDLFDTIEDRRSRFTEIVEADEALDHLPDSPKPIRRAYWLYHYVELPIHSKNPDVRTIARDLGRSRTSIEKYLAEADRILQGVRIEGG